MNIASIFMSEKEEELGAFEAGVRRYEQARGR